MVTCCSQPSSPLREPHQQREAVRRGLECPPQVGATASTPTGYLPPLKPVRQDRSSGCANWACCFVHRAWRLPS
ncbi:hypothetical protein V5799_007542 [Amblyomma americanum]|uniref:Uncharacterized protein n=1 Tax=Amblyomma americanum TaxID=6943 RepID=A0AAQ4FHA6_AMBAM